MKINKAIIALTSCTFLFFGNFTYAAEESKEYCKEYIDVLCDFMRSDKCTKFSGFSICDINSDGSAELIISEDSYHAASCQIYSFNDEKLIYVGRYGAYGDIGYDSATDILTVYNIAQGFESHLFFKINGSDAEYLAKFFNNAGRAENELDLFYEIDNEKVSFEKYSQTLDEYSGTYKGIGRDCKFTFNEMIKYLPNADNLSRLKIISNIFICAGKDVR